MTSYTHVVDDIFLRVRLVCSWRVHGTHDVHLIVLEGHVALVHVDYVIRVVYSESETNRTRYVKYGFKYYTLLHSRRAEHITPAFRIDVLTAAKNGIRAVPDRRYRAFRTFKSTLGFRMLNVV